jgi:hypothetical protein
MNLRSFQHEKSTENSELLQKLLCNSCNSVVQPPPPPLPIVILSWHCGMEHHDQEICRLLVLILGDTFKLCSATEGCEKRRWEQRA